MLMSEGEVKQMWCDRAVHTPRNDSVTHRDVGQRKLEIAGLAQHLRPTDEVLDVGCGNGWATAQLAPCCRKITGVDYSPEMIARAAAENGAVANASWRVQNVLELADVERYDVVLTVRCLINIVDAEKQRAAIRRIHHSLKPGGRFLMMEGVHDGRAAINRIRAAVGLGALPTVVHNLDFPIDETLSFCRTLFTQVHFEANGIYDLVTRVIYPYVIHPEAPAYESKFHELAVKLAQLCPDNERLSRFGLFVGVK